MLFLIRFLNAEMSIKDDWKQKQQSCHIQQPGTGNIVLIHYQSEFSTVPVQLITDVNPSFFLFYLTILDYFDIRDLFGHVVI